MPQEESNIQPRCLSVVVPVYNEVKYLAEVVRRIEGVRLPAGLGLQVVIVDDASTDGTTGLVRELAREKPGRHAVFQNVNGGKGAALRAGFAAAVGEYVLVQDADFEYDPADYPRLLEPLLEGHADVVYGSRFMDTQTHRGWHRTANRCLTAVSNLTTGLKLTDMECCYKLFHKTWLDRMVLRENRFGFEPEVTAKLARLRARIVEVPVSYAGRNYEQGKKIGWRDGVSALRCIVKYGLLGEWLG